ncbi:MAG TPA: glycosyltransferase family 1 protein, partial [Halieaceae bacterium]|nr:glycosyltransferase family 1 protein [Halieaceae bacterium]
VRELRIGVDVRPLCHPGTGIYRYTAELLQRMCAMGGDWFFYSPQPYDTGPFTRPNVRHRIAGLPSAIRASQTAQLFFPLWAKRDALDVFWGPRHQLPLFLPGSIRSAVTIHDLVWKEFGKTMRFPGREIEAFFMPRAMARATDIAVVSEFTRCEVEKYYPRFSDKVSIVTGASLLHGAPGALAEGQTAQGYFLFVGTLEPRKNLPRLLCAYARFVATCPHARKLKIVGGQGWGGHDTLELVRELSLSDRVEILGRLDDDQLKQMYRGAYALVMPSLYEGFGLPIAEALSMEVPVITSRQSAMSEVAGGAGLLVDPFSEREIADALRRLSENTAVYETLRARTHVESRRYDWDRSAAKMYRLLTGATGE